MAHTSLAFTLYLLLLESCTNPCASTFKQTVLTPLQTSIPSGQVSITTNPLHVSTITPSSSPTSPSWHVNPISQTSYDLLLNLQSSWSFHANQSSQLTLTFEGSTSNQSEQDGEFILVFASQNTKYLSVVVRLDSQSNLWKYYPANTSLARTSNVYNDIILGTPSTAGSNDIPSRWYRTSNNDEWGDILPRYKSALTWPLIITLSNNPKARTLLYECQLGATTLQTIFNDAFEANGGIDVYVLNDADDNKPFDLSSITVRYTQQNATNDTFASSTSSTTSTTRVVATNASVGLFVSAIGDGNDSVLPLGTMDGRFETSLMTDTEGGFEGSAMGDGTDGNVVFFETRKEAESVNLMVMVVSIAACLTLSSCVVMALWCYYRKREEEINSPHGLNKSEYHTPKLHLGTTTIEGILNKKRKESVQSVGGLTGSFNGRTQQFEYQSQQIVPINKDKDCEETEEDSRFSDDDQCVVEGNRFTFHS